MWPSLKNWQGAGALTKTGPYALTLTGANTYAGNTLVNEGKLVLRTGPNLRRADPGGGLCRAGGAGAVGGRLPHRGGLSLGSSALSTLSFDLGAFANPTAPLMIVTNLYRQWHRHHQRGEWPGAHARASLCWWITAARSAAADSAPSSWPTCPPVSTAELVNNTANSSIDLKITGAPGLVWTGAASSDWDYGTQNWFSQQTATPSTLLRRPAHVLSRWRRHRGR